MGLYEIMYMKLLKIKHYRIYKNFHSMKSSFTNEKVILKK